MSEEEIKNKKSNLENLILKLTKENIHTNGRLNDVEKVHLVDYQTMYLYLKIIEQLQQENKQQKELIDKIKEYINELGYIRPLAKEYILNLIKEYENEKEMS